jgi:hypothetical protein
LIEYENDKEFLKEIFCYQDIKGYTFLIHYFSSRFAYSVLKVLKEILNWIKNNFGLEFLKKFLLIKDKEDRSFFLALIANRIFKGSSKASMEVIETLLDIIGDDKDFFEQLITHRKIQVPDEVSILVNEKFGIVLEKVEPSNPYGIVLYSTGETDIRFVGEFLTLW